MAFGLVGTSLAGSTGAMVDRAAATEVIRELRRIVSPEGVERLETVRIGGIDQWVSIRGTDRRNPILLVIHGGPAFPLMPTSWYFQRGWEEYFTVVQWDQRGAGKTFTSNAGVPLEDTLHFEQFVRDAEALVQWIRKEFSQDRIVVLGHSWGSFIGLTLAQRRPQWFHAYVGVGQITDVRESERRGWQFALGKAREAGNQQAVDQLLSIAPYAHKGVPVTIEQLEIQRRWLNHYGGYIHGRTSARAEADAAKLSPEYSDDDLRLIWKANAISESRLLPALFQVDLSKVRTLQVPIVLFAGRHDHNVSSALAAQWLRDLEAPGKTLVWFEHSGHEPMIEEPGRFLVELVQRVRPLARP